MEGHIFKGGSTTFYWSSRFFPAKIRDDVFRFYSFVRVADDYVDAVPAKAAEFNDLHERWDREIYNDALNTDPLPHDSLNERVIKNAVRVVRTYDCDRSWIQTFFASMQMDLAYREYATLEETLAYMYGSAEVIALVMCRILGLPPEAEKFAVLQGRALQYINFLRDIDEDNFLGRCYFPREDLNRFGLKDLHRETAEANPKAFNDFMAFELHRYQEWQDEALGGFRYLPKRLRISLRTAVDAYAWTARQLQDNPHVVFERKVKPKRRQIIATGLINTIIA